MAPLAVLFDFDGVIADTENVHIAAWQMTLARIGIHVADEAAARAAEIDDRLWLTELFAARKIDKVDVEGWCRLKQEETIRILRESPVAYRDATALIRSLRGRFPMAVVSTTWRANVEEVLRFEGLLDHVAFIVGKEDVANVKPDPEGYRIAVERLGVPADRTLAIEDSPTGIAAAVAAEVPVLAVGHRRASGDWHDGAVGYVARLDSSESTLAGLLS